MVLISGGILVLMWILGYDFSGHYNQLALKSVDIISRVYCTGSVGDGHFFRYSRKSVTLGFFNGKFQFGYRQNVHYSGKSVISESGTSENLCTYNLWEKIFCTEKSFLHITVDLAYNIHGYKGQPVIVATKIVSPNPH